MGNIFFKDGSRYTEEQLVSFGIQLTDIQQYGYKELNTNLPTGYNPIFEQAVDNGTAILGGVPVVIWLFIENDISDIKKALKSQIASTRYKHEISGCVWQDKPVKTTRESRATMPNVDLWIDGDYWKFDDGTFQQLTKLQYIDMLSHIHSYVQEQYRKEQIIVSLIDTSTTIDELRGINLNWESII